MCSSDLVHMQTTVMAKIARPDLAGTRALVAEMVARIKTYIPGYQLILEPMIEGGRLVTMVRVDGLGDYLPRPIRGSIPWCASGST